MPNYDPLQLDGDDVLHSGWIPPSDSDRAQLNMMRGASATDLDKIMDQQPQDTYLWLALWTVLKQRGQRWKPQYQKYGTCVGQALKLALDHLAALNTLLSLSQWEGRFSVAGAYTFSRVEIGGQPGRWEGSNGYQAAAGAMKYGCLLLSDIGLPDDDLDNDENLAMKWTASRQGVPQEYEDKAGRILVLDVVTPDSIMLAAKLIQAGSPQIVGTTYIPTGQRNADGISPCRRSRGGHEMCVDGVRYKNGQPWCFHQQNSWSENWGSGPAYPVDMPPGGVWISAADYWQQIQDRDSSSLIGIHGLKFV